MRILAIRLRNLNSLAGSWAIDFTAPEYAASGIFAITGPTGAGKSTILDALCLALFARTPRLGHISKGSNEIMSRRAGDCFAEVEFETRQGHFRCHWAQHRARRSPDGELQPPRHEIVDAKSGKVLETRSKEVARLVEKVTGMEYDRFTRSILLAQGDFASFLDADADQRAPILEQITGTGIYSRISKAVHERTSEERRTTALLQEAMGSVVLLSEEEEQAVMAGINERMAEAVVWQQRLAQLAQALHRIGAIELLKAQLVETDRLLLDLARRREEAKGALNQLERGLRAQSLLGDYNRLTQVQERIVALRARSETLRVSLEQLRMQQRLVSEEHVLACRQVQDMAALRQREDEVMKSVRTLDLRIHEKKKAIAQLVSARQQTAQERERIQRQRQDVEGQLAEATVRLRQLEAFFSEHAGDRLLVEQLAGYRQQLQQLGLREQTLNQMKQQQGEVQAARATARQQLVRLGGEEEQAARIVADLRQRQQRLETERTDLLGGQTLAVWRQQAEEEEQRLRQLDRIADLLARQQCLETESTERERLLQELRNSNEQQGTELRILEDRRQLQQQLVDQCEVNFQLSLRIHSFEEERTRLVEGAPCPLCGATHHPFAHQEVQVAVVDAPLLEARAALEQVQTEIASKREALVGLGKDIEHCQQGLDRARQQRLELEAALAPLLQLLGEGEGDRSAQTAGLVVLCRERIEALRLRLQAIDGRDRDLQALGAQVEQGTARCGELQQQVQAARHAHETIDRDLLRLEQQVRQERTWIEECRRTLIQQLRPLGIHDCPPGQSHVLLLHLETRLQTWKAQQERSDQLARHQAVLQGAQDKLDLLLTTIDSRLVQQDGELEGMRREEAGLLAERFELYGDRDTNVEEQRLKSLVQQAETREQGIRAQLTAVDREMHAQGEQLRVGSEELDSLLPQSREQEARLLAQLPGAGFAAMEDFRAALLSAEQLTELGELRQGLDREQTALAARRTEQEAALAREEAQRGEQSQEELTAEQASASREVEALQQGIGADRERLAFNSRNKVRFEAQQQALAAQNQELERWELLHLLIGSADGKKFRVFAQNLTFEVMISHANRQLRKMSDRYLLRVNPNEPLALQVIDNYQAGEVRSTRNLSGGESFLVSLALALGLSVMASHNVQVDSLFLDEGFGTLDEEALDTALQTLAELRQDGKLIGIISHVPLLRERIDVRIQVQPGIGGNSRLFGPGCTHLA